MTDFRVFVTGSRDWPDGGQVFTALYVAAVDAAAAGADAFVVVHGGADGADEAAHCWCKMHPAVIVRDRRIPVVEEVHRPDWAGPDGMGAGYARNDRMASRSINICLAFIKDNSKGATQALGCAINAGVETRVWRLP